jgi:beta-lactamase class A
MPKLARDYTEYYSNYRTSSYSNVYNYATYANEHRSYYSELREQNRPHKKNVKKKNPVQVMVSLAVVSCILFCVLPYSFNKVTKAIFAPTPYKNIKTDMHQLAFPTHNYLANTWYLGERGFNYSANLKNAKMIPIKENVNMPALRQELMNLAELYPTVKPAIYVWDYDTGNYVDINASKDFATASIIKIPVLIDVFKTIEAGELSLQDRIPLTGYYRTEGSGSLQFKAENSQYTVDELAQRMITESDNSATNMLMAKIGSMTDVNQSIRDWGLKNTYVHSWLPDLAGNNRTTAREMATMLYNIDANDKFLSEESRDKIFNYMGHVHNDRLIQAGLGKGAVFLHKTGDIGTMLGDAGIVIAPNGKKYIVVILANRPHNSVAGKDFIVNASEMIYNYMVK